MMKNTSYLTLLLIFLNTLIFAQEKKQIEVSPFTTLNVQGAYHVILQSGAPGLHFKSGYSEELVKIYNENGILSVLTKEFATANEESEKTSKKEIHTLIISSPNLQNINLKIDGDLLSVSQELEISTLNLNATIKGNTKLKVKGKILICNFNDCGKIAIEGNLDKVYLNTSNSGNVDTSNLKAETNLSSGNNH
jgi:hypothetical protein